MPNELLKSIEVLNKCELPTISPNVKKSLHQLTLLLMKSDKGGPELPEECNNLSPSWIHIVKTVMETVAENAVCKGSCGKLFEAHEQFKTNRSTSTAHLTLHNEHSLVSEEKSMMDIEEKFMLNMTVPGSKILQDKSTGNSEACTMSPILFRDLRINSFSDPTTTRREGRTRRSSQNMLITERLSASHRLEESLMRRRMEQQRHRQERFENMLSVLRSNNNDPGFINLMET